MNPSITIHLKLTIDGLEIEAAVPVPTRPAPRRLLLPILQNLTDTIVQIAQQNSATPISCAKGCDACCRQMVPISPAEAHALVALLNAMPSQQSVPIRARFQRAREKLQARNLWQKLTSRTALTPEQLQQLDRDYFAAQIPCPFLETQTGSCSIHPARPLACREFLVTSPALHCQNPANNQITQLPLSAKPSTALAQNDPPGWLPLILTPTFTTAHPEETPTTHPAQLLQQILNAL